jgi:hypothetical protein
MLQEMMKTWRRWHGDAGYFDVKTGTKFRAGNGSTLPERQHQERKPLCNLAYVVCGAGIMYEMHKS